MRSKFERRIAKELDDADVKFEYETYSYEYEEPLRKNRSRCAACGSTDLLRTGWYTPDFFLETGYIVETKGRFTAADRRKMLAVKAEHPELQLVILFMRDNKIHKNSTTKYSDWCEANNYDYAVGTLDPKWLKEK